MKKLFTLLVVAFLLATFSIVIAQVKNKSDNIKTLAPIEQEKFKSPVITNNTVVPISGNTAPDAAGTVQIGSGTTTTTYFPLYTCYGYNYSQQIYLGSEITAAGGAPGAITKIRFYYNTAATFGTWTSWTIYMGNTTKTVFAGTTDWVPVASMTQVFSGNITAPTVGTWMEITLTTPFTYTAGSNLVVAVDENTASYACTAAWRSFTPGGIRGLLYYSDGTNPNPASPPTANYSSTSIAQVQFNMELGTNPALSVSALTGFGNVCINTTSGPNSFTITGNNLTAANVTVGALTGFTYSTTAGGTYSSSLSLAQPGGAYSQTIYVKFSPTLVQSYNGNIVVGGGGASNVNCAATGSGVNSPPTISTPTSVVTSSTTATLGGNITATGCSNVTERGIYYSTTNGFPNGTGTKVSETPGPYTTGVFTESVTGLTSNTVYYYVAFATNGQGTVYTTQGTFSTYLYAMYCTSNATSTADEEILNVTLGTLNNSSTCATTGGIGSILNEYSNYSISVAAPDLGQGTTIPFSVQVGTCGGTYGNGIAIWIDFNQNKVFDAGERVYYSATSTTGAHTETGSITIPGTATLGNTLMRVVCVETTTPNTISACGTYSWGETEDYLVNIASVSTPTLNVSALTGFGNVCINSTAGPNNFTVTGVALTSADVTVGPLSGFTFCTTSGGTYSSSLSIAQPGGSFSQIIYVKFSPTIVQSYNGNIPVGGGGASTVNCAVTGSGVNSAPTVTTPTSASVTDISALLGGNITALGCSNVTERGIYYSTTNGFPNGTGTKVSETPGPYSTGTFTESVSGLSSSTIYYYVAFATNSGGTTYTTQGTFTTATPPITSYPWTEPFTTWPPTGFTTTGGTQTWAQYVSTNNSAYCNFWGWTAPNNAVLTTPRLNLNSLLNPRLNFKWSHQYMASYPADELKVSASSNSGANWTVLWDYTGATFNSNDGAGTTTPGTFVTTSDISLSAFLNQTIIIKFDGISGYGPDVFIDDITVSEVPATPIFSITPVSKSYGNVNLGGGSVDQIFTFSNIGGGSLTIDPGGISLSGADANQFQLIDNNIYPISLNNGQSANIYIQFTPISTGAKSINLHIDDNTGGHDFPLTGTGILNPPQALVGGINGVIPALSWQAPAPEAEIKLDDGTAEQNMWVGSPSTTNQMFYDKFISPHNGTISQLAVYAIGGSAGLQFSSIMLCPDDGTGKPNTASPWATFNNVSVSTSISWIFLTLSTPQAVSLGQTFYIVTKWPAGSTTGPYIGTDNNSPVGRSAWTQDGGVTWNIWATGNFIMRAYMGSYTDKFISGSPDPLSKALPVNSADNIYKKDLTFNKKEKSKDISVPTSTISSRTGEKILSNYTLLRGDATGVYNTTFSGISALTYDDNSAVMGNTYYYVVRAEYTDGSSGYSNEVSVAAINPNYGTFASSLYKFSNSTANGNPAPGEKPSFEWIPTTDFTSVTTWTSGTDDDGYFQLNFPGQYFKFFGTDYSAVYIGTNGYVTFGAGSVDYTPGGALPNATDPFNMIAAAFKDLYVQRTYTPASKVSYKINPDNVVISFENIYDISGANGTNYISFQITLYTNTVSPTINSLFIINYNDDMSAAPLASNLIVTGASVGVNNGTGTSGYNYRYVGTKAPMFNGVGKSASALALGMVDFTSGTLPVKLTSFSNSVSGRDVTLNWITETETNNAGFEVYRRNIKDEFWTKLAYMNGQGNKQTPTTYRYSDTKLNTGKYEYKLKQIDVNGNYTFFNLGSIAEIGVPSKFNLSQNYPNPFNPVTKIDFDLPADSRVSIVVFDILGREIKNLVQNEFTKAGYYTVSLNASGLSSGTYFYRIIAKPVTGNDFITTKKMVVLK